MTALSTLRRFAEFDLITGNLDLEMEKKQTKTSANKPREKQLSRECIHAYERRVTHFKNSI